MARAFVTNCRSWTGTSDLVHTFPNKNLWLYYVQTIIPLGAEALLLIERKWA